MIEPLHRPSVHLQQRCDSTACIPRQHCNFRITPRLSTLQNKTDGTGGLFGISLQDMHGVMPTGLKAPNLNYELAFEKYFDNPVGSLTHMKFNSVKHRDEEYVEFLIDGYEWYLPTGGLTSAGSSAEYLWDIYVDGNFYGNFRGYSGRSSTGIFIQKIPERLNEPIVFLKDVEEFDSRYAFTTAVPLSTTNNYGYLPYWVSVTREGAYVDHRVGIHQSITFDRQSGVFKFSYTPPHIENDVLLIYQCVAVFPIKDDLTLDEISTYRLEIKPLEAFKTVRLACPSEVNISMDFCKEAVVTYLQTRAFHLCELPCSHAQARYYKHVPRYTPQHHMRVVVRPRSNYPLSFGWLRGYGFVESFESRELWNTAENKEKVVGVRAVLTPEMVCSDCSNTGNNAFRSWFDGCTRLQTAEITYHPDWRTVNIAGNMFGYRMFCGCSSLPHIIGKFTEPQSITACGDDYNRYKFAECSSLQYVSEDYTEPFHITETGTAFCAHQFAGCTALQCVSPFYTEPREVSSGITDFFNVYKFAGCRFTSPSPQYKESMVLNPGNAFLVNKWASSWN